MEKIAVIPAYEPTETLIALLRDVSAAGFSPVVVDDGSGAAFAPVFGEAKAYGAVLVHDVNRGKGRAMKTAFSYIAERFPKDGVVVTLDSDGQHCVEDAERACAEADAHRDSIVLGCRVFDKNVPLRSRAGNTITRLVYRMCTGARLRDTQTGLRAFGCEMLPFLLGIQGERYEYEMNVLIKCSESGVPLREIDIRTIYHNNNSGSHFNTLRDSFLIYRDILRFAASSLLSFCVDYGLFAIFSLVYSSFGASGVPLSNVSARVISATFNFTVNKKFVFKNKDSVVRTGLQYFALAALILLGNTIVLSFLVNSLGINRFIAKIITECIFFTISWLVQRLVIFRRRRDAD
jgi:putative flippase GtrA